jgi:hypothetical protein
MKRKRKQPRRMTPPLVLRSDAGDRAIIEVDDEILTEQPHQSNRTTAFLQLAPGLRVQVRSRSVNKRRITLLAISPADVAEQRQDCERRTGSRNHTSNLARETIALCS